MTAVLGVLLIAGTTALLFFMLPKQGRSHRLATAPVFQVAIPIAIITGYALGITFVFSSFF